MNHIPFVCVNCEGQIQATKQVRLFCSELCADEAKFVRYFRRCRNDGRIHEPDVQEAIQIRFAHIMGGGYDSAARKISKSVRASVFERDKGRCRICGGVGVDIDHISGDADDLDNLQLLCKSCHNRKTQQQIVEIAPTDPRYRAHVSKAKSLRTRCESILPLRLCDDEELWPKQQAQIRSDWRKTLN